MATALALVSVYFLYRLWRHSADDIKRARADVARLDGGLKTAAYAAQQLCAHFSLVSLNLGFPMQWPKLVKDAGYWVKTLFLAHFGGMLGNEPECVADGLEPGVVQIITSGGALLALPLIVAMLGLSACSGTCLCCGVCRRPKGN